MKKHWELWINGTFVYASESLLPLVAYTEVNDIDVASDEVNVVMVEEDV